MKARRQIVKDYLAFPALSALLAGALAARAGGPSRRPSTSAREAARGTFRSTLAADFTANIVRNVWAHSIIFCGHFPDQTYTFSEEVLEGETRGGWYVRQLLGAANIEGGALFHFLSGNLSFQVEHHLFPDMPSSRYAEVAPRVREVCARYGLPYNTGPVPQAARERAPHDPSPRVSGRASTAQARPLADALAWKVRRIANSTTGPRGPTAATRQMGIHPPGGLSRCRECHAAQAKTQSWDV